jgi:hypothetical protein
MENLLKKFDGLEISPSTVHSHMVKNLNLSVKKATFEPEARNSDDNLQARFDWFMQWKDTNLDFINNCVFIDEAGFHTNMKRTRAWSRKGEKAIVKTPVTRAPSHTIIGAISTLGVVQVSLRKPLPAPPKKKAPKTRKLNKGTKRNADDLAEEEEEEEEPATNVEKKQPKGTTAVHFVNFINSVLDEMDENEEMKEFYLVMDNASIHKSQPMKREIERRDYKIMYLLAYSPELNPIEQFWSVVKSKLKRTKLLDKETLSTRIAVTTSL